MRFEALPTRASPGPDLPAHASLEASYPALTTRLPDGPRHRDLRARLRARGGHARELRARRLGDAVLDGDRRLPVGARAGRLPLPLRAARPGPALHRGRARGGADRRRLGTAAVPLLRLPAPVLPSRALRRRAAGRDARRASRSPSSCASCARPSTSRSSSQRSSPSTTSGPSPPRCCSPSSSSRSWAWFARRSSSGSPTQPSGSGRPGCSRRCWAPSAPCASRAAVVVLVLTVGVAYAGRLTDLAEEGVYADPVVFARNSRYQRIVLTRTGRRTSSCS